MNYIIGELYTFCKLKKKMRTDEMIDPFVLTREVTINQATFKVKTEIDYARYFKLISCFDSYEFQQLFDHFIFHHVVGFLKEFFSH